MSKFLKSLIHFCISGILAFFVGAVLIIAMDLALGDQDLSANVGVITMFVSFLSFMVYLPLLINNPADLLNQSQLNFFKPTEKELTSPRRIPFSELCSSSIISVFCYFGLNEHCTLLTMSLITVFFALVTFFVSHDSRVRTSRRLHCLKVFEEKIKGKASTARR